MKSEVTPRRSVLYVPGSKARALARARTLAVDGIVFDLEDAVAPGDKETARAAVVDVLAAGGYGSRERVVRINADDTAWHGADLEAVAVSGADAVLVPKVSSAEQIVRAAARLAAAGAPESLGVWAMAETPRCILDIGAIACAHERLAVLVMGNEDLAAAMRLGRDTERVGLLGAMSRCVIAARAAGLDILDGVFTDLADAAGFRAVCEQGRKLGFDGKTLIHPGQVDTANHVFGVSDEDISTAQSIVSAWDAAGAEAAGIVVVDGNMIERLHVDAARRVLALGRATSKTAGPSGT